MSFLIPHLNIQLHPYHISRILHALPSFPSPPLLFPTSSRQPLHFPRADLPPHACTRNRAFQKIAASSTLPPTPHWSTARSKPCSSYLLTLVQPSLSSISLSRAPSISELGSSHSFIHSDASCASLLFLFSLTYWICDAS